MPQAPAAYSDGPFGATPEETPPAPVPAPAADDLGGARRRWLSPGSEASDQAAPAPKVKMGGTLFERMSNAARGAAKDEGDDGKDPIDIPRFLHRQNNQ